VAPSRGDLLVRGACGLARHLGISPLVIGLTVVAFGTSAPELAVNLLASWRGDTGLAFGNIVGSNLANLGLILGLTALYRPLPVRRSLVRREMPLLLFATALGAILGIDVLASGPPVYGRVDGAILVALLWIFLLGLWREARRQRDNHQALLAASETARFRAPAAVWLEVVLLAAGLVGLVVGADRTVEGGAALARGLGAPDSLVGLTVVAVGTSLPELATSLAAAKRRELDLAVGNVIGSNVFNLLGILGLCALMRPLPVPPGGIADLVVATLLSALVLPMAARHDRRIIRAEGATLMLVYLVYMAARIHAAG
jgi:cation:H+ antiporter